MRYEVAFTWVVWFVGVVVFLISFIRGDTVGQLGGFCVLIFSLVLYDYHRIEQLEERNEKLETELDILRLKLRVVKK